MAGDAGGDQLGGHLDRLDRAGRARRQRQPAGRFRVVSRDGTAEMAATDSGPDVRLDADTLGALYLGGVGAETLRRAGRLVGSGVETFAAMVDAGPAPYCITGF